MNEIIEKLTPLLEKVSVKMGEGGQYAWNVVIKQMYVEAVIGLVLFVVGIVSGYITYRFVKFAIANYKENSCSDWDMLGWGLGAIGGSIAIILGYAGLRIAITHFINPEFYAIEFFINLVK